MVRAVVDVETGEITSTLNEGDRIVRAKSIDSYADLVFVPKNEPFTKLYKKIMPKLIECGLTAAEFAIFIHLAGNLRYTSNVAQYENRKFVTRADIQAELLMSERTLKSSISRLRTLGLIVEANTAEGKVFVVNPYVVMVGDRINRTVYDLFRKSKWARW
jgi:biotin operon repressor